MRTRPLLLAGALVLAAAAAAAALRPAAAEPPPPDARPKVIVLGFDGLSADRVEALMDAGRLPHLAKLRAGGGYSKMTPSNPAQSPVSWASMTTGLNPGGTGIFDFLGRKAWNPQDIDVAFAARETQTPVPAAGRVALVVVAGILGAITAGALVVAWRRVRPPARKTKAMEIALTLGGAVFACCGFVAVRWIPETVPTARNLRSGTPFWVSLDRAGVRCVALEAPMSFPADEMHAGCCLSGLGVPDMAGTFGSFAVWSDDLDLQATTETGGLGYYVEPGADGAFELVVAGPRNPLLTDADRARIAAVADRAKHERQKSFEWTRARRRTSETQEALLRGRRDLVAQLRVTLDRGRGAAVRLQDGATVALAPGKWSDLLPVEFRANPAVVLRGRVRLLLEDAGGPPPAQGALPRPFRLFVGQVQWDLAHVPPNVGLTSPRSFAKELAADLGPAETIGWPEMTNPVKDRVLSDQAFLDHTYALMALRERRLHARLARDDFDCLFALFAEPDRVQHAMYRHVDPQSPTHDPEAAKRFGGEIDRIYGEADRIVGDVVAAAPGAIVLVVSDHGFAPFRRGVNLNNFLVAKGWQKRSGSEGGAAVGDLGGGEFFSDVDWKATKAYAMGLGNLYVNLAGREPNGSVPLDQRADLIDAIARDLEALRDADGTKVVRRVYRGDDLYRGVRKRDAPDLVVGFEWGYRVSWQTCLGACDPDVITPNTQPWSGDHCSVDPELVPAVVFSSRPLAGGVQPKVEDVAASVLALYGVGAASDGVPFLR